MHYQGRSPINDVVRSVVLGAAMIPPAVLAGCSGAPPEPAQPEAITIPTASVAAPDNSATAPDKSAPPKEVVRPRAPNGTTMPTRGFSGAARRGGARAT